MFLCICNEKVKREYKITLFFTQSEAVAAVRRAIRKISCLHKTQHKYNDNDEKKTIKNKASVHVCGTQKHQTNKRTHDDVFLEYFSINIFSARLYGCGFYFDN